MSSKIDIVTILFSGAPAGLYVCRWTSDDWANGTSITSDVSVTSSNDAGLSSGYAAGTCTTPQIPIGNINSETMTLLFEVLEGAFLL